MGAIIGKATLEHTDTENTYFLSEAELSQILAMVQKDGEVEELIEAGRPLNSGGADGLHGEKREGELQPQQVGGPSPSGSDYGGDTPTRKRRRQPFPLPPGWSEMYKVRQDGTSKGRRDVYYLSPDKKVFRSRAAALKYMKGGDSPVGEDRDEEVEAAVRERTPKASRAQTDGEDAEQPTPAGQRRVRRPYRCTVCGEIKKGHHCKGKPNPLPSDLPVGASPTYPSAAYPSLPGMPNAQYAMAGMGAMGMPLPSLELDSSLQLFAAPNNNANNGTQNHHDAQA